MNKPKQSQSSLYDQLLQVRALANQNGYYDAVDFITKTIDDIEASEDDHQYIMCSIMNCQRCKAIDGFLKSERI